MEIKDLTLNTPVYNYYYGKGNVLRISNNSITVGFNCIFHKTNYFELEFTTDQNFYYEKNKRSINELSLKDYEK